MGLLVDHLGTLYQMAIVLVTLVLIPVLGAYMGGVIYWLRKLDDRQIDMVSRLSRIEGMIHRRTTFDRDQEGGRHE